MAILVRKIDKPTSWTNFSEYTVETLPPDPLKDLNTTNKTISVYKVSEDVTEDHIATALTLTKHPNKKHFEFLILDSEVLDNQKFDYEDVTKGQTGSSKVNDSHVNIIVPTAIRLIELAFLLENKGVKSVTNTDLNALITKHKDANLFDDPRFIHENWKKKLGL